MRYLSRYFLAVSLALLVPAGSVLLLPASVQAQTAEKRFTSIENGFSIIPPAGWEAKAPDGETFLIYIDPNATDFATNLNVNVNADEPFAIEELPEAIKQMFAEQTDSFEQWEAAYDGFSTVAGQKSYYISSRFSMKGLDIQNLQYYIRGQNNRFYVVTFTALQSEFARYEPLFKAAVRTIQTSP
ncbi:MAG: hypothetical protein ACO1RX_01425 [Candidatus Sericytochromatia bacterium]